MRIYTDTSSSSILPAAIFTVAPTGLPPAHHPPSPPPPSLVHSHNSPPPLLLGHSDFTVRVWEFERRSEDTQKKATFSKTALIALPGFLLPCDLKKVVMRQLCLLTFAGEYISVLVKAGQRMRAHVNASRRDSYLPFVFPAVFLLA